MDKFKTFHSSSGRSLSIISILCPCWHLQIIIFFLRKIKKPKMTSFVKLAAITYLWLVWNKNGLVIVFIRKLIFCYMMIHLTVRINCTFLYSFMLRYICLCNWTPFLPNQPVAARGDEERDDSLIHHDNPRMWWSRMWWLMIIFHSNNCLPGIKFSGNCDNEGFLTMTNYKNIFNVFIKIFLTFLVKYFIFLLSIPYKELILFCFRLTVI